nr:NADH dehydrogenase subunit 4L [Cuneopsis celtiformis]
MIEASGEIYYYLVLYLVSLGSSFMQRHSLFGLLLSLEIVSLVMCFNFVCVFGHTQGVASFVLVLLSFEICVMCAFFCLMVMFIKGVGSDYVGVLAL